MSEDFHQRLREERMRLAPKQADFASKLGVRQSQLSEWEKGTPGLKWDQLALLADAGVDVLYVVTGKRGGSQLGKRESLLLGLFQSLDETAQATLLLSAVQMSPQKAQYETPPSVVELLVHCFDQGRKDPAREFDKDDFAMMLHLLNRGDPEGPHIYPAGLHEQAPPFRGEESDPALRGGKN